MAVSKNAIEIYKQILNGLGAPITEENLKFLIAWQKAEGGKATNNPFNTTYNLDVDVNKTKFNSHGVKNYTTPEYGITATVKTLKLPYYKNIVKGLQDNVGASNIASNIKELKTWGTGSGVAKVLGKNVSVNTLSSENVTPNRSLTDWAYTQEKNWSGVKEWDPKGVEILKEYNKRMGVTYNPSEHWSAITISNAVMADAGAKTKDEMRTLGFNPTKSHSGYVGDAFKTASNSDYKYNRYVAEKLDGEYKIGDILVKGRKDGKNVGTSKWSYEDFANSSKGYPSHGDIIVNEGQDSKGKYVILAGGNLTDTYKNSKLYLSDIDKKNYKVKLNDTKQGLFISEDGNLIDQPKLDNKTESVEDVLETNVAENETLENDIDETLETDVDETNIVSQRDYDLGFGNDFRLSDSAQMALFGTVLYPKNNSNSDFNNISYQDLQNTNEEEDFELLKPESEEEIDLDLDVDVAEDVEDIESTKNEKAWWTDDKENTKDITKKEYDTPKSMRASYLEGDITTKEYQEYLKTTPKFKSDYDNLIKTSEKKLRDLKKVVNKEKYSRPAKGSFSYFKPEVTGYRNIYGYTDADFEKIKEPYIDFANKYGYDPKTLLTKKTADERTDAYSTGISYGEDFFENTVIKKDLETYEKKYKEYNRLKDGFTKIGYDVDKDGNISRNGEIQPNTINDFIENEKNGYEKFDFSTGNYIPDESRASSLQLEINQENCNEKGLMWIPASQKCGTLSELNNSLRYDEFKRMGPQSAGGDGGFFFNTIFGAANLAKLPLTYAGEMAWETAIEAGMEPVIEPIIDAPFDAIDGAFGTPDEQYNVRKKYLSPIINAKTKYWKEGGSIELNLNKKEVLNYAKNGYIVEELPQDQNGKQELVGVSHLPPPSFYTYNNNQYAKRGAEWFKMINGNYHPLTAGNVPNRSKVLNKYAKLASKPEINESRIMDHLKLREGKENKTYKDTKDYLTGGVGHKLTKDEIIKYPLNTTIPQSQIDKWLVQDSRKAIDAAKQQAEELQIYDPKFVEALTAVNFQLGTAWNTEHKNTWGFMKDGAFDKAAVEAADSDWYNQTPVRVKDFQKALKQINATKLQDGGFIEIDLTEEAVNKYKDGGYVLEEIYDGAESGCPEGMASDGKGGCIEIASVFNEQEEFEKTLPKTERKYYDKEGNLLETVPDYGTIYVTGKDDPKYKEYQDRLKFYNKAKKLHNDEGIKEWTRQVANMKDLYDSQKNNPTDWSADEISRSKKRYENLKGQKELYTDYRGDYKSERYTSQLPTMNWEDAKIASQKKSDWATYWDLGAKGSIQGTYGDYDHIPDAWSDLLSEALKTTARPTKYFRGEGNMKPVFTYPSLNVKVLDEALLKEKSPSTPTTPKAQDPDEIYGEHSFRTGNRVVNGVLTPAEPKFTPLPTRPLEDIEITKSTPNSLIERPVVNTTKRYVGKKKTGKWIEGSDNRSDYEVAIDKARWEWAQKNKYKDGGEFIDLTDAEIQAYRDGGYIVEELPQDENGGGASYADSLAAYNYGKSLFDEEVGEGWSNGWFPKGYESFGEKINKYWNTEEGKEYLEWMKSQDIIPPGVDKFKVKPVDYGTESTFGRVFYKKPTKPRTKTYEDAYKNVDKKKYPTLESFIVDAKFWDVNQRNMTDQERAEAQAGTYQKDVSGIPVDPPGPVQQPVTQPVTQSGNNVVNGVLTPAEPESTSLPTKPLVKKSTPGTVVPPAMELKWFKSNAGTWYQDYVPTQGKEYNLNTGSYLQNGGYIDVELNDNEVEQYKDKGYVVEMVDGGGLGDPPKYNWGPKDKAERASMYKNSSSQAAPNMVLTYKDDADYIDGISNWQAATDVSINAKFNDQIKKQLYTGNFGYNPANGALINLKKARPDKTVKVSDESKELMKPRRDIPYKKAIENWNDSRVRVEIPDSDAWNPEFKYEALGKTGNTSEHRGGHVYMTKAEAEAYEKAQIVSSQEATYKNPLWYAPGMIFGSTIAPAAGLIAEIPNLYGSGKNIIKGDGSVMDYANLATAGVASKYIPKGSSKFKLKANSLNRDNIIVHNLDSSDDAIFGYGTPPGSYINSTGVRVYGTPPKPPSMMEKFKKKTSNFDQKLGSYFTKNNSKKFEQIVENANKHLEKGLGIKKVPLEMRLSKPSELGYVNLEAKLKGDYEKMGMMQFKPMGSLSSDRKFSQIVNPFNKDLSGYEKVNDFPYNNIKWLEGTGGGGEAAEAINRAIKDKGYNLYSSTSHMGPGQNRYIQGYLADNPRFSPMLKNANSNVTSGGFTIDDGLEDFSEWLKETGKTKPTKENIGEYLKSDRGEMLHAISESQRWKYKRDGGEIRELTDEEVEQYKAGGYIIEEYPDGGITGGPEYDSRYGILGRFGYKNNFKGGDRSTQNTLSADIYGGRFGLGARGAYEFGSEKRGGFPAKNFMKTTIGRDNVRGFYGDVKGGSEIHAIKDRTNELNITPFGGFSIQSKATGSAMPDADLLGSRVGLNYGIGANYKRKFKNDSNFNVYGSISGNPVLGKFTDKESYESENTNFAPQFNVGIGYTRSLNSNIRKINKKIKKKQKNLYPISNSSGSRASFTYEQ